MGLRRVVGSDDAFLRSIKPNTLEITSYVIQGSFSSQPSITLEGVLMGDYTSIHIMELVLAPVHLVMRIILMRIR